MEAESFIKKLIELMKEYNRANGVIITEIDIAPRVATYEDGTIDLIGCKVEFKVMKP